MNKQFKFFLTSAAIAAALVGAVSCQKDYSGDIDDLNSQISALKTQLTDLEITHIQLSAVIKGDLCSFSRSRSGSGYHQILLTLFSFKIYLKALARLKGYGYLLFLYVKGGLGCIR